MIYLDNSATTKVHEEIIGAMIPYFSENYFNPSSVYPKGLEIKKHIEESRNIVAKVLNALPEEVYFTSGGTESNNLAIQGALSYLKESNKDKKHIICSCIEHHSVLKKFESLKKEGYIVDYLPCDKNGIISIDTLNDYIREDTALVSVMYVNNEIGSMQNIKEISKICKNKKIIFHSDAVQGLKSEKIDVKDIGIDLLSISSHKIYGPKGVGALYCSSDLRINPLQIGGGQEKQIRPGTENVPGIIGFAKACEILYRDFEEEREHLVNLKSRFIDNLKDINYPIKINGDLKNTTPSILSVSFKDQEGEGLLFHLSRNNIAASMGSACNSKSVEPSHVISSLNLEEEYKRGSLRFSFGRFNTIKEIDTVCKVISEIIKY